MPDLTLFFDVPPEIGLKRIQKRHEQNRLDLEAQDFHYKVYEGYQMLVQKYKDRIRSIDATKPKDRSEEHTSELQSRFDLVCRLLLEKKKHQKTTKRCS